MIKESTHWYDQEGKPQYTVIGKNGKERNTTLRDARVRNYVPSVTSVMGVAAKPGLENWKIDQALLSALTLPRGEGESLDSFMARAKADSRQQAIDAAAKGTEIHAYIESGFSAGVESRPYRAVKEALDDLTGLEDGWVAEDSFAHPFGFGGKIDLYHPDGWVVDFKTKDNLEGKDPAKLVFDEHGMQLAAYACGLNFDTPKRVSVFIDRENPEIILVHLWNEDTFEKHLKMFLSLLQYWQISKNYDGSKS